MYDALTSIDSAKAWGGVNGDNDNGKLQTLVGRCSELIGKFCGRPNLGNIYTYTENYYPGQRGRSFTANRWELVMRHYPIVSLTSVLINNAPVQILGNTDLQVGSSGVYVEEADEPRTLSFNGIAAYGTSPVLVTYTAGYLPTQIPGGLQQACDQFVIEIYRAKNNVNLKSQAIQGETTAFDMGGSWPMSNKVQTMLTVYKNVVPFYAR